MTHVDSTTPFAARPARLLHPRVWTHSLWPLVLALLSGCADASRKDDHDASQAAVGAGEHPAHYSGRWNVDQLEFVNDNRAQLERELSARVAQAGIAMPQDAIRVKVQAMASEAVFTDMFLVLHGDGKGAFTGLGTAIPMTWVYRSGTILVSGSDGIPNELVASPPFLKARWPYRGAMYIFPFRMIAAQ